MEIKIKSATVLLMTCVLSAATLAQTHHPADEAAMHARNAEASSKAARKEGEAASRTSALRHLHHRDHWRSHAWHHHMNAAYHHRQAAAHHNAAGDAHDKAAKEFQGHQ